MNNPYTDPTQHFFWLSSRALGIVAIVLLAASVTLGLSMSAKLMKKPGLGSKLRNLHEGLALAAVAAVVGHGLMLTGDKFLKANLVDITMPFAMDGQPAWTGIGIIGGWLMAIFSFSYYVRRWIGTRAWRKLHRFTIVAYLLAVVHTVGSGTDAGTAWMVVLLAAISTPIVFGLTVRLLPKDKASVAVPTTPPARRPREARRDRRRPELVG